MKTNIYILYIIMALLVVGIAPLDKLKEFALANKIPVAIFLLFLAFVIYRNKKPVSAKAKMKRINGRAKSWLKTYKMGLAIGALGYVIHYQLFEMPFFNTITTFIQNQMQAITLAGYADLIFYGLIFSIAGGLIQQLLVKMNVIKKPRMK